MHFNLLFTTLTISVLILTHANEIQASKRIKRQTELKMANNIDNDFGVLKPQKREDNHELSERNVEKNDGSNQQSKENENKLMKRPAMPAMIVQEKVPITITHAARVVKLPKKLVLRNPSHHNPQLIQHYSPINDDPILDYLFNTLGGAKPLYPNVQSSGPLKAQYDVPRTRTIIYAPPVILKQPAQQHKQMESLMENALTSLLLDDSNALATADDAVCASHAKSGNANGNVNGSGSVAIASDANIDDNKSEMSNNDGNVIQFCSCHFIKRLKEKH